MGTKMNYSPTSINLGFVGFGHSTQDGGSQTTYDVAIPAVPTNTNLTAHISDDNSGGGFAIRLISSYKWTVNDVDPNELLHSPKNNKQFFDWELDKYVTGSGQLAVEAGERVYVEVTFTGPLQPTQTKYSATLQIQGEGWDLIQIPLTAYTLFDNPTIGPNLAQDAVAINLPDDAFWQRCTNGISVFYSPIRGPVVLATIMIDNWGLADLGNPLANAQLLPGGGSYAYFERGMLVARPDGNTYAVAGNIYLRYQAMNDVHGFLGLPTTNEKQLGLGVHISSFEHGDLYWRADIGAKAIYGAIRDRWQQMQGFTGLLGFPLTDELPVIKDGREVGRFNRFEGGMIYWSPATGAHEVYGAIRQAWENNFGGATGQLGFPTSGETDTTSPATGGRYNNFEHGVLVWHAHGPYAGVHAVTGLDLFLARVDAQGQGGTFGGRNVYMDTDITSSIGSFHMRFPSDGAYDRAADINQVLLSANPVQGNLVIRVVLNGWDANTLKSNEHLGTVDQTYNVDNLWGTLEDANHWRGDFLAVYKLRNGTGIVDLAQFRQQDFWSFPNFNTVELSRAQFDQTFSDVDQSAAHFVGNTFDSLFYNLAYKGLASSGNCFGVCLESIDAQVNQAIYREPLTAIGDSPEARNEINIKHGYQISGDMIDWFLGKFDQGQTHNPVLAFQESRAAFDRGDYPVLALSNSVFQVGGHVVRPYRWNDHDPNNWIIYVANPNNPANSLPMDGAPGNIIQINPNDNTFSFQFGPNDVWQGGEWLGGRMYSIPYSRLCYRPHSPFWEVFELLLEAVILIFGGSGQTTQLTDGAGRTFYEPNLGGPPTQWQHLRRDPQSRIPNLARIPLLSTNPVSPLPSNTQPEFYYFRGRPDSLTHTVQGGDSYNWAMRVVGLATSIVTSGGGSAVDTFTIDKPGTPDHLVTLTTGAARVATMTLSYPSYAGASSRNFELSAMNLLPGAALKTRLVDAGQELMVENGGPALTFSLKAQAGNEAQSALTRAGITLEAGQVAHFRPVDWQASNLASVPVRMNILDRVGGQVLRQVML